MQEPEPFSAMRQRSVETILLSSPTFVVEERAFVSKLSIRGLARDSAFRSRFRNVLGVEPPSPGIAVNADVATILQAGPTEWLAVDHQPSSVMSRPLGLRDRLVAEGLITIDLSSSMTILRLSGSDLHPTMRRLAALPLDRMPARSVARTRIGKLAILVHVLAPHRLDLFVPRSFAKSFFEQLQDAMSTCP